MINGAQSVLDDVVITDTPSPNQVLDPESLVIYGTNVKKTERLRQINLLF